MTIGRSLNIIIILAVIFIFPACKPSGNKHEGSAFSIQVTDFRNKDISLAKPATRIVCLIESGLSGLYMLQAESKVIGVSSAIYNESAAAQYASIDERIKSKKLPTPGNWDFVSIENIVALQPDLVIIWASQTEAIQTIEEHGIPVYGVFLKSFNDVYKEIKDFGTLTGTSQRADSLIDYTKSEVSIINNQSKTINIEAKRSHELAYNRKSVYFMWPQGLLETAGTTSTVNELIELAGAKNSCIIAQEHVVINKERLLDWNPDLMVLWYNPDKDPDNLTMPSDLKQINAIKNKQVYELPSVFECDLWTLKFPYAVKTLAKWCYPDAFANLNLDEEKRRMMIELYGKKGGKLLK